MVIDRIAYQNINVTTQKYYLFCLKNYLCHISFCTCSNVRYQSRARTFVNFVNSCLHKYMYSQTYKQTNKHINTYYNMITKRLA